MTTRRTTPAWKDSSFRAARPYWPVRWRLHWAARHDRRSGLPVGLDAATTPLLRELVARRDHACERVRARYHADVGTIDVRLAAVDVELAALGRSLDEATAAARAAAPPTEHDPARRKQADIRRRLDAVLAEEAELEARRRHRSELARSQALALVAYADRLAALYRRALIRRHPQRDALLSRWDGDVLAPPSWLLADDLSARPPGCGAAA